MKFSSVRFLLFRTIVRWLSKVYLGVDLKGVILTKWAGLVQGWVTERGTVWTIGRIKSIRLCYTRHLAGTPLSESPGFGVELTIESFPKGLAFMHHLFRDKDPILVRYGLTLLGVSRLLPGWKAPDLSSVTNPGTPITSNIVSEATSIVKKMGWKLTPSVWTECHVTTKSGPNAQALIGSVEDASLLSDQQISDLEVIGGEKLTSTIGHIRRFSPLTWISHFGLKPKGRLAKLGIIKDKESKSRVVAILDYWTQSALKPLHEAAMLFLKELKGDCTFNQGSFSSKLPSHGPFHSLDLSNATDRFPVVLQEAILAVLITPEYAAAWRRLTTDRDYHVPRGCGQGTVRYAVGQPMGAYSSWAVFSICHHVIVRVAMERAGLSPFMLLVYVLLGDDIVIAHDKVAAHYRAIMGELGVEISESKTHVSADTYEFAKRWIHKGLEVTGAPLGSFFEALSLKGLTAGVTVVNLTGHIRSVSFAGIVTWLRELESRWLPRSVTKVSRGLLAELFLLLGMAGYSDRLASKSWKFFLLPVREDSRSLRKYKTRILGSYLLKDILTCESFWYAPTLVGVYLNECKARVLEEAIKRHMKLLRDFQLEMSKFLHVLPEGLDAQSLLWLLPPFAVIRTNIRLLQLEFDKAHKVRESDDLMQWLHLDVRLFLDPFATLSTRASKTVAMSKATILNYVTAMCRGIGTMRALAVTDIKLESFIEVMQRHTVLPTSGNRRTRKKSIVLKGPKPQRGIT